MNAKRFSVLGILGLFLIAMMGGVFAADVSSEAGDYSETVITAIGGFAQPILEPFFGEKEMLTRVFFALLLGMILYSIISVLFKSSKKWVQWGITIMITSLSLLGLPSTFLEMVRTQYGAMGAAILTVIPFLIVLVFSLRSDNFVVSKLVWAFYAMYYFAMYGYGVFSSNSFAEGLPYGIACLAGIFVFFFIKEIRNLMFKGKVEGMVEKGKHKIEKRKALQSIQDMDLARYE